MAFFGDSGPEEFTLFLHPLIEEFSQFMLFQHIFISQIYSRTNNAALLHSSLTHILARWVFILFEKSFSWFVDCTATEFYI